MAYGDIGGPVTELIVTCKTPGTGTVAMTRGDAVKLIGAYEATNVLNAGDRVFGQVLVDCTGNNTAVPVRVRGICDFRYSGTAPVVDGVSGIEAAAGTGMVRTGAGANASGLMLKVNSAAAVVETLL
jgi:hypothetical protein